MRSNEIENETRLKTEPQSAVRFGEGATNLSQTRTKRLRLRLHEGWRC